VNSLPKTVARQRRDSDLNQGPSDCQEPGSAPEPYARQSSIGYLFFCVTCSQTLSSSMGGFVIDRRVGRMLLRNSSLIPSQRVQLSAARLMSIALRGFDAKPPITVHATRRVE